MANSYIDRINTDSFKTYNGETLKKELSVFPSVSKYFQDDGFGRMIIWLRDSIIEGPFYFPAGNKTIKFSNCIFTGEVKFHEDGYPTPIILDHCYFDDSIIFDSPRTTFHRTLDIIEGSCSKQLRFSAGKFKTPRISFKEISQVSINGGDFEELKFGFYGSQSSVKNLVLDLIDTKGIIHIQKSKIDNFHLLKGNKDSIIQIDDTVVNSFSIYRYRNEGMLRIFNLSPFENDRYSQFSINDSYLGKADFNLIDLHKFKEVTIKDSNLLESSLNNIYWPKRIFSFYGRLTGDATTQQELIQEIKLLESGIKRIGQKSPVSSKMVKEYYLKNRETYRQIKYLMNRQGDYITEQSFHAKELLAYDKGLSWSKDFWTRFIIKFSQKFSNFGQSIWRPLQGLFIGHFVMFSVLILFFNYKGFYISSSNHSWIVFEECVNEFLFLINPLRKFDTDYFPGYSIIIDIAIRIWASFMIYNILRASRRFIR